MARTSAYATETIEPLSAVRNAYIEHFRIYGEHQPEVAAELEEKLKAVLSESDRELHARALYELATIHRLTNRYDTAIEAYQRAAAAAENLGLDDLAFDAWLGVSRSHAYGTRNHGAAVEAFRRAIASAGADPTPKQSYEMADYASQLQAGRGELDAALVNAIEAVRLARSDSELFYAQLDAGDVLQKFAESCDYRKLIDAKTSSDEGDSWGACRRAVGAAKAFYDEANDTATRLGWNFLVEEAKGFSGRLEMRLSLIQSKASFEKFGQAHVFTAQDPGDVLVNENFASGGSELSEFMPLGELIEEVIPDLQSLDPRSLYLLGIKADLDGRSKMALDYFKRAVDLLQQERSSLFDLRRRGTVIESRPELVRDLALRLLALGELEESFQAFESIRSRGLSELASAFEENRFTKAERQWLANLVEIESQQSAILGDLVETAIAGIEHSKSIKMLEQLNQIKQRRRELLQQPAFQKTARRLATAGHAAPPLRELEALVRKTNIPVMLYWVASTNVIVWVISPEGMSVKSVFLPEVAVIDKVVKVGDSIRTTNSPFDEKSARELHTYLIKPFSKYLSQKQVLIVPQGPLVTLPFEALIDAETGKFLVEDMAISYAPNAFFAARVLGGSLPVVSELRAVFDENVEISTGEISRIGNIDAVQIEAIPSKDLSAQNMIELLGQSENVHVLLHGIFSPRDPLQSRINLNNHQLSREENEITAAELLAVDWRETRLAVFSSCEGAIVNTRISNEVYGLSWAPLVGGVNHVLLSRWRVSSVSNADWMETFYTALASGTSSPAMAASTAMRKMIATDRNDPFFWAGPQIFGR